MMVPPKSQPKVNADTDANMIVFNDSMSDIINVQEYPSHMGDNFISGPINPASSRGKYVSANSSIYQSAFGLETTNASGSLHDTCHVNIGQGFYETNYNPQPDLNMGMGIPPEVSGNLDGFHPF